MTTGKDVDPTYNFEEVMAGPTHWRLAFQLSELFNDNAPIGWGAYIELAERTFEEARKIRPAGEA